MRRWAPAGYVGFSVAEPRDGDGADRDDSLCLAHVVMFPEHIPSADLVHEIPAPLLELLEEEPEARELMRGRTFARSLHERITARIARAVTGACR